MTNKEAKQWILDHMAPDDDTKQSQVMRVVIKALEQQPCEDCISREAVLETIEACNSDGLKGIFCSYDDGERFKTYIKDLPPATPKEKTGKWIDDGFVSESDWIYGRKTYRCSSCNFQTNIKYVYCPNCGCRMVESQESEEK